MALDPANCTRGSAAATVDTTASTGRTKADATTERSEAEKEKAQPITNFQQEPNHISVFDILELGTELPRPESIFEPCEMNHSRRGEVRGAMVDGWCMPPDEVCKGWPAEYQVWITLEALYLPLRAIPIVL